MLSRKSLAIASLCTIVCSVVSNGAAAGAGFKSSEFLKWSPESQRAYISTAVTATAVIAAQNIKSQASCINKWGASNSDGGYQPAVEAMNKLPDVHPMVVIVAVLQKACGQFNYAAKASATP